MRKIVLAAFVVAASLGGLSACSDDLDRDEAVELVKEQMGLNDEQAECVADKAIDQLGLDTLNEDRDPTAEEIQVLTEITTECLAGDLGDLGEDSGTDEGDDAEEE
jgi:hypothetical protein